MRREHALAIRLAGYGVAIVAPPLVTLALIGLQPQRALEYVFLYLAIVGGLGLTAGLWPSLIAAALSSLCVDFFFVVPYHTLTVSSVADVAYLAIFFASAGVVGGLTSRRRRRHLDARALSQHLREANAQMERLYAEQAAAARTAVRLAQTQQQVTALRDADRIRRELLQNVSHELRTPLASILTGATVLLGRSDLSAPVREGIVGMVAQSRRLDRLVGDMLDLARIEGHALELHLEPTDVAEIARDAAGRLRRMHPERQVTVTAEHERVEAVADEGRLGQILDNLLVNADRYAPPGTAIEVRIAPGARDTVVTRVVDHGSGVPPELRERVFERFVRDEAVPDSGTGLGLAIVRGLVEAHAGRVWLDDATGDGGAVFAFTLPAVTPVPD